MEKQMHHITLTKDFPFKSKNDVVEIFIRLRKYSLADLAGINYINEEYIWFQKNGENLLDKFREKFEECVGKKNNNEILKFFEFFSQMNILVSEIKNITNKSLKDNVDDIIKNLKNN